MKKEFKAISKEFNNKYNIIAFTQNVLKEFYLQKKGYGNLYYICGVKEQDFELSNNYISQIIQMAEDEKFWREY